MEPHRIVIVGGGFGGLKTAFELAKRRARIKDCSVTLVDQNDAHLYTPLLYEVASGELELSGKACADEIERGVSVRFDAYANVAAKKNVRFVRGAVLGMEQESRTVLLSDGKRLPYDDLVIAVGAETATYGIPGVLEHAIPLKTLRDGFRVRDRIHASLKTYARETSRQISFVVVGGGATGVEFVAELANYFQRLVAKGTVRPGHFHVTIVESGPEILPSFSSRIREKAKQRLVSLGVKALAGVSLKEVRFESVSLCKTDGSVYDEPADVTVWTAGMKSHAFVREWGLPVDEHGFIKIDRAFAVEGMRGVYALGDCASFLHPKTNVRVPALAQAAVREAGIVAENIVRHLERKAPTLWNPPERWTMILPVGGKYAIADLGVMRLYGRIGYLVLKAVDLMYFLSVLAPRSAWKLWRTGSSVYAKND
ncbi:hypothetical protein A2348_05425 [Candidatus Uhrbacteria bacterium RIFOXYB12_FULL_58_10]|uniref:FAD/NAD(P)-binding domain-containing protein n=1 Tax=Candidatus Uhrbacteria bacterium RIFOXYB2_FULL_57_15 TaxID=1802422 RepID=A0A1F7W7Z6_9BACT|nr:MAG: hypothetical protein A2348_05425 [Candidatus Uhrbacteria bacterium RIFOXYB12_FULL_58_10]OGL98899.1 MAG: hypothetical protein A2304_04070 [Candidatus Uhrbacteria bacterium RIFOXYB2_FULL_57_15]OGM00064.1 MAG: hypothetical protein A2501_03890 [Candidatus Uhrbacteria bacterium RIFOXYC12_FULL_57_11]